MKPNMLQQMRTLHGVTMKWVARRLGVRVADVKALEHTPFDGLKLEDVARYADALGFRLHVGIVHQSNGNQAWLFDSELRDEEEELGSCVPPREGAAWQ